MNTPILDKMLEIKDKSQIIGEFIDWLRYDKNIILAKVDEGEIVNFLSPINISNEQLLADFFEINLDGAEKERQQILNELRNKS